MEERAEITEGDVIELMDLFTRVPVLILKGAIKGNMNAVKRFEDRVESYKYKLTPEEMNKIRMVTEMPVPELQKILYSAYLRTGKNQLKILAHPHAQIFIEKNLNELKKILFTSD